MLNIQGHWPKTRILLAGTLVSVLAGCTRAPKYPLNGQWQGRPELDEFDFTMRLHFAPDKTVEMVLDDPTGRRSKQGTWRVLQWKNDTVKIQMSDALPPAEIQADAGAAESPVTRQFELRFSDGNSNRFTLTEVGSVENVGAIIFERVE